MPSSVAPSDLHDVFAQAPVAICVFRGEDYVLDVVNAPMAEMLGRPIDELAGRPFFVAMPELREQGLHELLEGVRTSGVPFVAKEQAIRLARHEGESVGYFDFVYQPLRDAHGTLTAITCVATDVTEQVLARIRVQGLNDQLVAANSALRHERGTVYQVFERTPAIIAILRGPEHRFEYVNAAYERLFPGRELLGLTVAETQPESTAHGFVALLDNVYRTGETFFGTELELPIVQPDGSSYETYFTFTYQAFEENGATVGVSVFAYDVTEQVRARHGREAESERLRRLFLAAPAAICILEGEDLVFELVNPVYQSLFPSRALQGRPLLVALPEIAGTEVEQTLRTVRETGETHEASAVQVAVAGPDGSFVDRYFNYIQQARRNVRGDIDGVLVFAFEVTEQVLARKASEDATEQARALAIELDATNQRLTRTNVDLDNFIYTASHDLKAPISNIEGLLHTLEAELPPADETSEVPFILGLMHESVDRFTRTIAHLTDLSKVQKEHGQAAVPVLLAPVLEDVRLDLKPLVDQIAACLELDVDVISHVTFSAKNLRSVLYNLLANALNYRHPERLAHVRVLGRLEPEHAVIEVHDNGLGLDLARVPGLFGMFRRYHTHVDGSGIGLYMVKRMLENAGGRIEVESTLGLGSTFRVYFRR